MLDARTMRTLRFKLDPAIQELLTDFAQRHREDTLADYRLAWGAWLEENEAVLENERKRLGGMGYKGDANDKMYKAGRYYFARTKTPGVHEAKLRKARKYVAAPKSLLVLMDQHIAARREDPDFRPALGFNWFIAHHDLSEATRILEMRGTEPADIQNKMKHTYKNRCFLRRKRESSAAPVSARRHGFSRCAARSPLTSRTR